MKAKEISIDVNVDWASPSIFQQLEAQISQRVKGRLLRLVVTKSDACGGTCEVGFISSTDDAPDTSDRSNSILTYLPNKASPSNRFTVVLSIPTGIGAEIGGHAGDAGPFSMLLGEVCDRLILHPNVVNASDINEMPPNALYVEGSTLTRLLMGTGALAPVRSNRVGVFIESGESDAVEAVINSVNAAVSSYGLNCPFIKMFPPTITSDYAVANSGRITGTLDHLEELGTRIKQRLGEIDCIAIASSIKIPTEIKEAYYAGQYPLNPYGGAEALLTHYISETYGIQSAHSPMITMEDMGMMTGIVDPRLAAEVISVAFFQSVLKGLRKSPRLISVEHALHMHAITASDVDALVIPDGCLGLPILAALHRGTAVIAVRENRNLMRNPLSDIFSKFPNLYIAETYLEACGLLVSIKAGIATRSLRRPLNYTPIYG